MATLGDILKQNNISLKPSVKPRYRRFSDAYLSLKGDPAYADLVTFEQDCEEVFTLDDQRWTVASLNVFVDECNTYADFTNNLVNGLPRLNAAHNNIYTDEFLNTIWTQILTLKQQVQQQVH